MTKHSICSCAAGFRFNCASTAGLCCQPCPRNRERISYNHPHAGAASTHTLTIWHTASGLDHTNSASHAVKNRLLAVTGKHQCTCECTGQTSSAKNTLEATRQGADTRIHSASYLLAGTCCTATRHRCQCPYTHSHYMRAALTPHC